MHGLNRQLILQLNLQLAQQAWNFAIGPSGGAAFFLT
jgi:hypothetical protein